MKVAHLLLLNDYGMHLWDFTGHAIFPGVAEVQHSFDHQFLLPEHHVKRPLDVSSHMGSVYETDGFVAVDTEQLLMLVDFERVAQLFLFTQRFFHR